MSALERFLSYITVDTNSNEDCEACPSSPNQLVLGQRLRDEMDEIGISDARQDENGYVYGFIPASEGCEDWPVIGFIAHMDTSSAVPGGPVHARIVRFDGNPIPLGNGLTLDNVPADLAGKRLVVTDGSTLLGADNKAGVAEILTMAEALLAKDAPKHGRVAIAFTPDEEIGRGADRFDVKGFGAQYAYTVDGGRLGEMEYENFNAASAVVTVKGISIHPGSAKNAMVNACTVAREFDALLPAWEVPEHTEGYDGFHMLAGMKGHVEEAELHYIIRDHDRAKFEARKKQFADAAAYLNTVYGEGTVTAVLKDSYYNMKDTLKDCMYVVDKACDAFRACGVEPVSTPIRGGTDGARLCYMGLPCPNLSTGGYNFHGKKEFLCVEEMDKMVEVLLAIVRGVND